MPMAYGRLRDHIEKLNVFIEVSRAKSFHKAARNLRLSQPSLSQSVKILEDTLETRLFVRSRKGVELTQSGQKLLYFSERLISEVEGMENRIRHPEQPMIGSITLGTYASLASYLLPKFLTHMAGKYDELTLGVSTLKADELAGALMERRCHFVIGTVKFVQKTITQFELYQDYFGFFCSRGNEELSPKTPLIYVSTAKDGKGRTIEKTLKEARIGRLHQYDLDSFDSVKALVSEGLGVGVLPVRLAAQSVQSGELLPVSMPGIGKRFGQHQFYCSLLTQDMDDVRIATTVKELSAWCKKL
jgi:DNA-binding transcriptional LysR family regulator